MRGNEFLDKMELVDPEYVKEAGEEHYRKKHGWVKWGAAAACFGVISLGAFSMLSESLTQPVLHFDTISPILNTGMAPLPATGLEKISIPEFITGGMGFEGLCYYDESEIVNGNPWNEDMEIDKLPVYVNKAYDASRLGVPNKGLSEKEMRSILNFAVSALELEVVSTETMTEEMNGKTIPYEIQGETNLGAIRVEANGTIFYWIDKGIELPEGYSFTDYNTTDSEAYETIEYLSDRYSKILNMKNPKAVTWGHYDYHGRYNREYSVYDASGDDVQDILNYNFCFAAFYSNTKNKLLGMRVYNDLSVAQKVGDYPIVSVSEAEERLLSGHYQTSVPYPMGSKEQIVKAELVYRSGPFEEMLIPYYRFYVFLPKEKIEDEALKTYGAYYVPAITDEYIEDMPVYDGHFN